MISISPIPHVYVMPYFYIYWHVLSSLVVVTPSTTHVPIQYYFFLFSFYHHFFALALPLLPSVFLYHLDTHLINTYPHPQHMLYYPPPPHTHTQILIIYNIYVSPPTTFHIYTHTHIYYISPHTRLVRFWLG